MLSTPISITYAGTVYSFERINQDNYASTYRAVGTNLELELFVSHRIPARGKPGESHLVRLRTSHLDPTTQALLYTNQAHLVMLSPDSVQSASQIEAAKALKAFASDAILAKILARES
jgi:hypothetical protein